MVRVGSAFWLLIKARARRLLPDFPARAFFNTDSGGIGRRAPKAKFVIVPLFEVVQLRGANPRLSAFIQTFHHPPPGLGGYEHCRRPSLIFTIMVFYSLNTRFAAVRDTSRAALFNN